jgi:hypothetical protein
VFLVGGDGSCWAGAAPGWGGLAFSALKEKAFSLKFMWRSLTTTIIW